MSNTYLYIYIYIYYLYYICILYRYVDIYPMYDCHEDNSMCLSSCIYINIQNMISPPFPSILGRDLEILT